MNEDISPQPQPSITKNVNIEKVIGDVYIGDKIHSNVGSVINTFLLELSKRPFRCENTRIEYPIDTILKIKYNHLENTKHIIHLYQSHSSKIEKCFLDLELLVPFAKDKIMTKLQVYYWEILDKLNIEYMYSKIDIKQVQENSDKILILLCEKIKNEISKKNNSLDEQEVIDTGVQVIVAHAFIECAILEKP